MVWSCFSLWRLFNVRSTSVHQVDNLWALWVTLLQSPQSLVLATRALRNGSVERLSQTWFRPKTMNLTGQECLCLWAIILHRKFALSHDLRIETTTQKGKPGPWPHDSDLPSNVSVETAIHPGCWLIPITVEGVQTLALLDTGASVSMKGRPLYQKVQQVSRLRL